MSAAISLADVRVVLDGTTIALDGVSAEFPANKIIGLIGPSGAGKTTLMRAIVGRKKLQGGSIRIFDEQAGSPKLRSQLSYMTQELSVYSDLTVSENLRYFATMLGMPRDQIAVQISDLLQTVGLADYASRLVASLSGGQKQRTSLAIALIGKPRLMVLDEPTVGLDPLLRQELWQLFRSLADNGTTLVVSSHVMDEAERCDELTLLRSGKILAYNSPAALRQQTGTDSVEQSFLKLVGGDQT